ncbi:hypothetical protein LJR221_004079 [Agrobacterium tumefaciens]
MTDVSSWSDNISLAADIVTIVGLPIAIFGLLNFAWQMKNDRLAVSAGAIGEMRASINARIEGLQTASKAGNEKAWKDEFSEFANDLEMACAIYLDGQMSGRTGKLAKNMICDLLNMINDDDDYRSELERAIHSKDTFGNIRAFRRTVKRNA